MGDNGGDPDRSSEEVKTLLSKLGPKSGGNHKDRVRRLARFRNYVTGGTGKSITTPEFYDDDFGLLLLGSQSPSALYDDELSNTNLIGLLQACGTPSTEHSHMLKRSAKTAMGLLKFLVCDFVEMEKGKPVTVKVGNDGEKELNGFAHALCVCNVPQLRFMKLEMHMQDTDDKRGGAKEDACEVLVLLMTRHLDPDGETSKPLKLEELLSKPAARKSFDAWLGQNKTRDVQNKVRRAAEKKKKKAVEEDGDGEGVDVFDAFKKKKRTMKTDEEVEAEAIAQEHAEEQLDELGLNLYSKDALAEEDFGGDGPPTKWSDSKLCTQEITLTADARARDAEREEAERAAEKARLEEEKQKLIRRDPLGIRGEDFDLRKVEEGREDLVKQALKDIEEEIEEYAAAGAGGAEEKNAKDKTDQMTSLEAQHEALQAILEGRRLADETGREEEESKALDERSILPTEPNFDPLLFLTLVHRNAGFEQLMDSIGRLDNKTDNQVLRLQNLVRDNFDLFVRCADGIDLFSEQAESSNRRNKNKPGVKSRLDRLDALAESCSYQAKKSFKPLLDNTNEVRKVQSALAVLQRVGPLLQAPNLMRQHLENGRFSAAVKAYRRVLVIDDNCNIELLRHVKSKAAEAAREARKDLEATVANPSVPVSTLLDSIRDLGELIELDVPKADDEKEDLFCTKTTGAFTVGDTVINVREHPPALACLLVQSAHFSLLVEKAVNQAEDSTQRIFDGETVSLTDDATGSSGDQKSGDADSNQDSSRGTETTASETKSTRTQGNKWKYDVLEARVIANQRAVSVARNWLPRLLRIGVAAREAERRRAARIGRRRPPFVTSVTDEMAMNTLTAFEVFVNNISPTVVRLVEHATFCALGCSNNNTGDDLKMSFGQHAHERLQSLLRAPLPPTQSAKCAKELADLVEAIHNCSTSASGLRPSETDIDAAKGVQGAGGGGVQSSSHYQRISLESPLEECTALAEDSVVTVERRRCIYAFDICARNCSMRASGSGTFDGDALLLCVQKLSDELTRPEECANEVEKGCELVVRRCCEGLASYVRDRGDAARLRAVAECADALNGRIVDVVREVSYLTSGQCETVEEALAEDIMALEGAMFDEFLDNIRNNVAGCSRLGWMDVTDDDEDDQDASEPNMRKIDAPTRFPAYLSASLLAIVRCRAQVERALGETTIRRSEGVTYQFLAMATAADGVIDGICTELNEKMPRMRGRQADRMANELQFLINTLKNYLSDEMLAVADNCRRMLCSKAGRGGGIQGDGPDGLAAIEELERLGRVYVLCLGE